MALQIPPRLDDIDTRFSVFARERLRSRDLRAAPFPLDIWRRMGGEGLLEAGLPTADKPGGDWQALLPAGRALVRESGNLGFAFSFLVHQMLATAFVAARAPHMLRDRFLPEIIAGKCILSLAVSEPGAGAHPKHLSSTAAETKGAFILNGEKAYLTNGPLADLFLVLAQTRKEGVRKRYTLFLVPENTMGLGKTSISAFDFLRPSPHGGILLRDCRVPASHVVGEMDTAYESLIRPFRNLEATILMGAVIGALECLQQKALRRTSRESERAFAGRGDPLPEIMENLARAALNAAVCLETGAFPSGPPPLRQLTADALERTTALLQRTGADRHPAAGLLRNDLAALMKLGLKITPPERQAGAAHSQPQEQSQP